MKLCKWPVHKVQQLLDRLLCKVASWHTTYSRSIPSKTFDRNNLFVCVLHQMKNLEMRPGEELRRV